MSLWRIFQILFALFSVLLISSGCASNSQEKFASPDDAANALVDAVRANNSDQLKRILGPDGSKIVWSGDSVADRRDADQFVTAFDQKHEIVAGAGDDLTLLVGQNDWPKPIPIVKAGLGEWRFDTARGKDEILNRRIGKNESSAIQTCLAIVDAQREYVQRDPDGDGLQQYAQHFISTPGTKDGLYWPTAPGEEQSPLGELIAQAAEEGYSFAAAGHKPGPVTPYRGYFFHMLKSQGPDAPGGARDYIINGQMICGFATVAWPAEYGNSGVMTFIVSNDGVVYQKDLGPNSSQIAPAMRSFDPGAGWTKVEQ